MISGASAYYLMIFFFNDTATTEIYTLSLHDALPISPERPQMTFASPTWARIRAIWSSTIEAGLHVRSVPQTSSRSEEHTSELQSRQYLVCRLLLEKKKKNSHILCLSMVNNFNCTTFY